MTGELKERAAGPPWRQPNHLLENHPSCPDSFADVQARKCNKRNSVQQTLVAFFLQANRLIYNDCAALGPRLQQNNTAPVISEAMLTRLLV